MGTAEILSGRITPLAMTVSLQPLPVQFLPLGEDDLPRVNELANLPEIAEHFEQIPPVTMETTQTLWSYVQAGIASIWGIHLDGRIIGVAGFYGPPAGTRLSHSATFFLYVEPACWGRGIGTAAVSFLEKEARKKGYQRMECMVAGTNPRAVDLYRRLGYAVEGVKRQAFLIDDTYADLVLMGRVFSPGA